MLLTKAMIRILRNVYVGRDPFEGGGNGQTREVIRKLNRAGLLKGHVLTNAGKLELEKH